MSSKPPSSNPYPNETIKESSLEQALGDRYLSYALSTITARSLPDVRDGLKPVQRRILYAMKESGNTSEKPHRKSASAVGYVMMKYHPHGNDPIYEAMVRLAQDFASRYPMVDGQGNFGSIDGDNAAAMRYTESRLTLCAAAMLEGIDEDAVEFGSTYNSETKEPMVLPGSFPNLLANGAVGIAVGMATSIPPHNAGELCDALLHLIKAPDSDTKDLLTYVQGPDFPTGGVVVDDAQSIQQAYETGRGGFRIRAHYEVETLKSGLYQIIVTEIPYQIQKARLIEKIADLMAEKKLPLLADIRDESTTDIRMILTPRSRTIDPAVLMETLFKATDLEVRFNLNMNVLDLGRIPRVMSLADVLKSFLKHRQDVLCRRTAYRLEKIAERLEIVNGFRVAYLNLDEVIRIIRFEDEPKDTLKTQFSLTDNQADAILNMRLKALRKLEEMVILQELKDLETEQGALQTLLADAGLQWKKIAEEITTIRRLFGIKTANGARRTRFAAVPDLPDVPIESFVPREPVTIVSSTKGWIRSLKGHQNDVSDLKYKEGDEGRFVLKAETTDKLLVFATNGRCYTLGVDKLPGGRGAGEPIRLMIELPNDEDIVDLLVIKPADMGRLLLIGSSAARGFVIKAQDVLAQTKGGRQVLNLTPGAKAMTCTFIQGSHIMVMGQNRKILIFDASELPEMTRGQGVLLQRYKDGGLDAITSINIKDGLSWRTGERVRFEKDLMPWFGKRASAGRLAPMGFPRVDPFGSLIASPTGKNNPEPIEK